MAWCIYKHTNNINGKIYIGQTCQQPELRWRNGEGYQHQELFYRAIQKYGWDNFTHEVIEDNIPSSELADEKEKQYIKFYHSCVYDPLCNGYNMTWGGGGNTKWSAEEEALLIDYYTKHIEKRIDLTELLVLLPHYSKDQIINKVSTMGITNNKRVPWSAEENEIMFQFYPLLGSRIIEKLPNRTVQSILQQAAKLGLQFEQTDLWTTEETELLSHHFPIEGVKKCIELLPNRTLKAIQSKASELGLKMNDPNQNRKGQGHIAVIWLDPIPAQEFNSIAEASLVTGDCKSDICNCCQGKAYSTHGHHYLYATDPRAQNPQQAIKDIERKKALNNPRNKPVRCKTTGEIFISAAEAQRKYPTACKIGHCCRGERRTSGKLPDGTPLEWEFYIERSEV